MCKDLISKRARIFLALTNQDIKRLSEGINIYLPDYKVWLIPTELDFEIVDEKEMKGKHNEIDNQNN